MITVCCIASGPSLCRDDCKAVERSGITTIAVNNSWQMARFASYIYAGDKSWWVQNGVWIDIPAKRICCDASAHIFHGTTSHTPPGSFNSGQQAVRYAMQKLDAKRIILLGYDCSVEKGVHWHGNHAALKNPTAHTCQKWMHQFNKLAKEADAYKADIINCSRDTALECFRRMPLDEALCLSV